MASAESAIGRVLKPIFLMPIFGISKIGLDCQTNPFGLFLNSLIST
jgi:hypothetical protein